MPISDYTFKGQIFFARESSVISAEDARRWAEKLAECAQWSVTPIVALVDALDVTRIDFPAVEILSKASYTPNVLAVVVASSSAVENTSKNIGLLGKRNQTLIYATLEEARSRAEGLLRAQAKR